MPEEGPTQILVVDDEPLMLRTLQYGLVRAGYVVATASNGHEALRQLYRHQPDVVLLDALMPELDGWETCRQMRAASDVPIVMVTALGDEQDIVRGLDTGADDYVTKPFRMAEMLARIRAVWRRYTQQRRGLGRGRLAYDGGRLVIDLDRAQVEVQGQPVSLSATEFRLLAYLAANQGRVLDQRQILEHVWGPEYVDERNYVKVYVSSVRQKIEADPQQPRYIIARRGLGYLFRGDGKT